MFKKSLFEIISLQKFCLFNSIRQQRLNCPMDTKGLLNFITIANCKWIYIACSGTPKMFPYLIINYRFCVACPLSSDCYSLCRVIELRFHQGRVLAVEDLCFV